jgi:group I intron endonuclease
VILCLPVRKLYIGQSINVGKRFREHRHHLRRGIHHNRALQKAWNKWGEKMFVFTMIEETSRKKVLNREAYWITTLKVFNPSIGFNRDRNK